MNQKNSNNSMTKLLKQMFISSRPISWINTAYPFAAGYLASGGSVSSNFLILTLYFLIPYNFLIYIVNDVFDYESDVRNPRKNSIEGGLLPPDTHRFMLAGTIFLNVIFLGYIFVLGNANTNLVLIALAIGALTYSLPPIRLKERPFLDSVNSSIHFVGPLVFALVLTGWESAYWPYIIAFFFWGSASHAFGAVQDIVADRKANISSVATYLGAKKTVRMSLALYIAVIISLGFADWPAFLVSFAVLMYVKIVIPYINLNDSDAERANTGWRKFLLANQLSGFLITILLIYLFIYR